MIITHDHKNEFLGYLFKNSYPKRIQDQRQVRNYRNFRGKFIIGNDSPSHSEPHTYVWLKKYLPQQRRPLVGYFISNGFLSTDYAPYNVTSQTFFGCDIILTNPVVSYWETIRWCWKKLIDKNKQNKNKKFQTIRISSTWEITIAQ